MDYLKFVGLSFLTIAVLMAMQASVVAVTFAVGIETVNMDSAAAGVLLGLVISAWIVTRVPPPHLKMSFFVWVLVSLILRAYMESIVAAEVRTYPNDSLWIAIGASSWWFKDCLIANPVCYLLGKYLWKYFSGPRDGAMDGRVKPGHDMRAS